MKFIKILLAILVIGLSSFVLEACQQKAEVNTIKVGTIAGPETQLMEVAKKVAQLKHGIDIQIVQFSDYNLPNEALNDGSIDANMFQSIPYFDTSVKKEGYKISIAGKTFIYPMAIYSVKIKDITKTPDKAIVAIPNDPSNEARALLLLQKAGLIKLKAGAGTLATPDDIKENPKNLQIKEIDAAQIPRILSDVTLAAINTNFAVPAGLYPNKNGIFVEDKDSLYANVIAVRTGDEHDPGIKALIEALHSDEVLAAANKLFQGTAIPAWDVKKG